MPVGEDQQQHLELTRDLAEIWLYIRYRATHLTVGLQHHPNILSFRDVTAKLSKSAADPNSRILLTDSHETIKRIRGAVTDSIPGITCDPVERPGTSNLLTILSACIGEVLAAVAERYAWSNHGSLKKDLADTVEEALRKPRAEFARLREDRTFLGQVARDGAEKARTLE